MECDRSYINVAETSVVIRHASKMRHARRRLGRNSRISKSPRLRRSATGGFSPVFQDWDHAPTTTQRPVNDGWKVQSSLTRRPKIFLLISAFKGRAKLMPTLRI